MIMLLLSRKIGEKIMIGDNVEIVINEIKGKQVVIGVSAPREVAVDREEIHIRKQSEISE
jgi:carbon storage regulator